MPWISITEDDVKTRLSGPELSAFKSAALASGQGSPLPDIINQVVNEMRGYIAACESNQLGAGTTIPDKLLGATLAMIRYRLATRLPVASLLDENRINENREALRLMERVAACSFRLEEPDSISDEKLAYPKPSFGKRRRHFGRRHEEGI